MRGFTYSIIEMETQQTMSEGKYIFKVLETYQWFFFLLAKRKENPGWISKT